MSIFRDVINEYYVAEGSKKVRAAKRAGALRGQIQGRAAYGYIVDENDKSVLHIDEEVAGIIREIYRRIVGGENPSMIARDFNNRGIPSPNAYYRIRKGLSNDGIETRWFLPR
jgi:DNA invertase Pin-like site-specific DNA recombinase